MARTAFILGEILFLALAHAYGGPPWTLVGVTAFLLLAFAGSRGDVIALVATSLLWLALAQATGNRELFFPYSMQLAAVVAGGLAARGPAWSLLGGSAVAAAFLVIRAVQRATPRVLAVELAVAAVIIAVVVIVRSRWPRHPAVDAVLVAGAAAAAYAGLAL